MAIKKCPAYHKPRILFLDAYDSFTNNIIALLGQSTGADVDVIKIDDSRWWQGAEDERPTSDARSAFVQIFRSYNAVVAGPGPGNPCRRRDVGLIRCLWALTLKDVVPTLGICLGFQSMCRAFGASISTLKVPRHGIVTKVSHNAQSIFEGLESFHATQYHSLHATLGSEQRGPLWDVNEQCPSLLPLAWDLDDPMNGPVLMAAEHTELPFWGVQYHPESICTDTTGANVIRSWWQHAQDWNAVHRWKRAAASEPTIDSFIPLPTQLPTLNGSSDLNLTFAAMAASVQWTKVPLLTWTAQDICEVLGLREGGTILLESGTNAHGEPVRTETGRFSIIGVPVPDDFVRYTYYNQSNVLEIVTGSKKERLTLHIESIWRYLKDLITVCERIGGPIDSPFWGGLVGYFTYEAGLDTISVPHAVHGRPDACFVLITRSIVIDHQKKQIYVQSIGRDDMAWIANTQSLFLRSRPDSELSDTTRDQRLQTALQQAVRQQLSGSRYRTKVSDCQIHITKGDSYELCLTGQTRVALPRDLPPSKMSWSLYRKLMRLNPAPFGAYLLLGEGPSGVHIASSSPERFLSWTRNGVCQYRPIKGTYPKASMTTLKEAEAHLNCSKERAENLMIMDLIRHDLHGVVGAGNVRVTKLMGVEEYETMYQLVSVIEGDLKQPSSAGSDPTDHTGIDVLAASLPPGSMTGAPKKRSCELLQELEECEPRSIYSGVLGYLDVGGGGDFSVIIRTAFHWNDEVQEVSQADGSAKQFDVWRVGAGGAVTAQSSLDGEYAEMEAKRDSTLRMFDPNIS